MFSLFRFVVFIILTIFLNITFINAQRSQRTRLRSCSIVNVPNALLRFKHNVKIMRINCVPGFVLQGSNIVACENGKWNAEIPVCTKQGCPKPEKPQNGFVMSTLYKANLYCMENYKIVGGRVTYCNGTHWDRPLGKCEETSDKIQLACDFESDDLCGWSHDETHNFDWKRVMAGNLFQQLRTGPQHDHTTFTADAGHYMLMESFDQQPNNAARLISPIYSKAITNNYGCFRFFYFMYGAAVGSLNIYVRPVSEDIEETLQESRYKYFGISGNQKNFWKVGLFIIKQFEEDFQVIIEGTAGINHLSDVAIDDVELMPYSKCSALSSTGVTGSPEMEDYAIFDVQSCEGRCSEIIPSNFGITNKDGVFYKSCDCHQECESLNTCCPNYGSICEFGNIAETTTDILDSPTVILRTTILNYTKIISSTIITSSTSPSTTQIKETPIKLYSSTKPPTPSTTQIIKVSTNTIENGKNDSNLSTLPFEKIRKSQTETDTASPLTTKASILFTTTTLPQIFSTTNNRRAKEDIAGSSTKVFETTSAQPAQHTERINLNFTSQLSPTTETILVVRKDKIITWQIPRNKFIKQKDNNSNSLILNLTFIAVTTLIVCLTIKYHKLIIKAVRQRHLKEDHGDATVLIYNQSNEAL